MTEKNDIYSEKIGTRLKNKREERHLSYAELSALTGVSKSSLQRYETGSTKKIPMEAIAKLENALLVANGYLMGWTDEDLLNKKKCLKLFTGVDKDGKYIFDEKQDMLSDLRKLGTQGDFCVLAPDDTMLKARIKKDDIVFVCAGEQPENGEIAVYYLNGKIFIRHAFFTVNYWTFASSDANEKPYITENLKADGALYLGRVSAFFSLL